MAAFFDDKLGACACARSKCSDECSTYRNFKPKPQTNADRIRAMSDEELARFVTGEDFCELLCKISPSFCNGDCEKWMLDWLKSPVEEGE